MESSLHFGKISLGKNLAVLVVSAFLFSSCRTVYQMQVRPDSKPVLVKMPRKKNDFLKLLPFQVTLGVGLGEQFKKPSQ